MLTTLGFPLSMPVWKERRGEGRGSEDGRIGEIDWRSVNRSPVLIKYRSLPGLITPSARTLMLDLSGLTGAVRVVKVCVLIDWLSILKAIVLYMYSVYMFYLHVITLCLKLSQFLPLSLL